MTPASGATANTQQLIVRIMQPAAPLRQGESEKKKKGMHLFRPFPPFPLTPRSLFSAGGFPLQLGVLLCSVNHCQPYTGCLAISVGPGETVKRGKHVGL